MPSPRVSAATSRSATRSAGYQATRDRLCAPLFDVVDRIASHEWDQEEIARLLSILMSALADEVEAIAELEPVVEASVRR